MSPKLFTIFLIIVPVVLYMIVIKPLLTGVGPIWSPNSSIESLQQTNMQYSAALQNTELIKSNIKTLHDDYTKINSDILEKNAVMLPASLDEAKLRNEVTAIANKQGIAIENLQVKKDNNRNTKIADYLIISFGFKAGYPALKLLLTEFDKSKRFYHVDSLTISRPKVEENKTKVVSDSDILNVQLSFRVYQSK